MGGHSADISRDMYNEAKRFVSCIWQMNKPAVDADFNDEFYLIYTLLRRIAQIGIGDGALEDDSFRIEEIPAGPPPAQENDFQVLGGTNVLDSRPYRLLLGGHPCLKNTPSTHLLSTDICSTITGSEYIGGELKTKISDSSMDFLALGLDPGRTIRVDVGVAPPHDYVITDIAQHYVKVAGNATAFALVGNAYNILTNTPGAPRIDIVWLNAYLDEIDSVEDPDLIHTIGGISIESMRRLKIQQSIFVQQDWVAVPPLVPFTYIDADGNQHYVTPLARIDRLAANPLVTNVMITDIRRRLINMSDPHHARHESGGSDEIDVAGLSGLLADMQTALPHALGDVVKHTGALANGQHGDRSGEVATHHAMTQITGNLNGRTLDYQNSNFLKYMCADFGHWIEDIAGIGSATDSKVGLVYVTTGPLPGCYARRIAELHTITGYSFSNKMVVEGFLIPEFVDDDTYLVFRVIDNGGSHDVSVNRNIIGFKVVSVAGEKRIYGIYGTTAGGVTSTTAFAVITTNKLYKVRAEFRLIAGRLAFYVNDVLLESMMEPPCVFPAGAFVTDLCEELLANNGVGAGGLAQGRMLQSTVNWEATLG
jgi:hypothetical protein